jgi:hypothetical protein
MNLDLADQAFRQVAEDWLGSLDDDAVADLTKLFDLSPGYYPTTLSMLREAELKRRHLSDRTPPIRRLPPWRGDMPASHPVDYDWRFTPDTAVRLVDEAVSYALPGACVLHLGTPSTFVLAVRRHLPFHHVLIEGNAAVVDWLDRAARSGTVLHIDLTKKPCPHLDASVAIVDPPWYPDYTILFLMAASDVCSLGAAVLLCQPTESSRPGVVEERQALLGVLPDLGLEMVGGVASAVRYGMPHFERMALRKLLPAVAVPWDWRTGDLLVLRKIDERRLVRYPTVSAEDWSESRVGPVRIKVRASGSAVDVDPLVAGDILDTVSRRDQTRSRIGMWTSGNRVYGVAHPDSLRTLLDACHADWLRGRLDEDRTVAHGQLTGLGSAVARRVHGILQVELAEHT